MKKLLLFSLILSVLVPHVAAQDDLAAKLDTLKEVVKFMKRTREEPLLVEAVRSLDRAECPATADELLKLTKHSSAVVQRAALDVLAGFHDPTTFSAWIAELGTTKDQDHAALLSKLLGRSKQVEAAAAIEAAAIGNRASTALKFEAARALAAIGTAGTGQLWPILLDDREPGVRMAALDAVGVLRVQSVAPRVIELLADPEWQVQAAAIEAAARLRPQAAVQPLIDQMRKSGRLRMECADALYRITAIDFGVDPERWQEQWNALMKIEGWRIPTDAEWEKMLAERKLDEKRYVKPQETNSFAGIPTTSTNVLFIIDVSGSMEDLVVDVERFQGYRDRKRFTVVQTELMNTLDSLTSDTNFDILAFATDIKPWKKRLVPANVVNREAAKSWVKSLKPIGGSESQELALSGLGGAANLEAGKTNTLKALLYAFGIDGDKGQAAPLTGFDKEAVKRPLDTIYFLSDGRPSVGRLIDPLEILAEVRRLNEVYRMVIHTIAIGDFQKQFLEQLAKDNGGVYVDLGR
jgi:hypothetical protein